MFSKRLELRLSLFSKCKWEKIGNFFGIMYHLCSQPLVRGRCWFNSRSEHSIFNSSHSFFILLAICREDLLLYKCQRSLVDYSFPQILLQLPYHKAVCKMQDKPRKPRDVKRGEPPKICTKVYHAKRVHYQVPSQLGSCIKLCSVPHKKLFYLGPMFE